MKVQCCLGTLIKAEQSRYEPSLTIHQIQLRLSQSLEVVALIINDHKIRSVFTYRESNFVDFVPLIAVVHPGHF